MTLCLTRPAALMVLLIATLTLPTQAETPTMRHPPKSPPQTSAAPAWCWVFLGSSDPAIYRGQMDLTTGQISQLQVAHAGGKPTWMTLSDDQRLMAAVDEAEGQISTFHLHPATGQLDPINSQPAGGRAMCYVDIDPTARLVAAASYTDGKVVVLPLNADGSLKPVSDTAQHHGSGADAGRQTGPHTHCATFHPTEPLLVAADLGTDELYLYRYDTERGTLTPPAPATVDVAPGSGPRHLIFTPDGRTLYLNNELAHTVETYTVDPQEGRITLIGSADRAGGHGADLHLHPSDRFLYATSRLGNTISAFAVDPDDGTLTVIEHTPSGGDHPRGFGIDPTGRFLVVGNAFDKNVQVFPINPDTGRLGDSIQTLHDLSAVCVVFVLPPPPDPAPDP